LWEDKTLDEVFELAAKREKEKGAGKQCSNLNSLSPSFARTGFCGVNFVNYAV